jgi:hypothetical protein
MPLRAFLIALITCLLSIPVDAQSDRYFILYQDIENNLLVLDTATEEQILLLENTEIDERKLRGLSNGVYGAVIASNRTSELVGLHPEVRETLYVFDLRDGRKIFARELLSPDYVYVDKESDDYSWVDPYFIEDHYGPRVFWSPDKTRLLWTEGTAIHNEARLGIFSTIDETFVVFPEGQGVPTGFKWSPDSSYLLYYGILHTGTGGGVTFSHTFVITPDLKQFVVPTEENAFQPGSSYIWISDSQFLYTPFDSFYITNGLYLYDAAQAVTTEISPPGDNTIISYYIEPDTHRIIFGVAKYIENTAEVVESALYRIDPPYTSPVKITDVEYGSTWVYAAPGQAYSDTIGFLNIDTGIIEEGKMEFPTATPSPAPQPTLQPEEVYKGELPERSQDGFILVVPGAF